MRSELAYVTFWTFLYDDGMGNRERFCFDRNSIPKVVRRYATQQRLVVPERIFVDRDWKEIANQIITRRIERW